MTMMNRLLNRLDQLEASSTQGSKTKKHLSKGSKAKHAKATHKASKGDGDQKRKAHVMSDSESDDDESGQRWVHSSDDNTSGGEQTSDDQYEKLVAVFGPGGLVLVHSQILMQMTLLLRKPSKI